MPWYSCRISSSANSALYASSASRSQRSALLIMFAILAVISIRHTNLGTALGRFALIPRISARHLDASGAKEYLPSWLPGIRDGRLLPARCAGEQDKACRFWLREQSRLAGSGSCLLVDGQGRAAVPSPLRQTDTDGLNVPATGPNAR